MVLAHDDSALYVNLYKDKADDPFAQRPDELNGRATRLGAQDRAKKSTAHYSDLVRFAAAGIRALVRNETDVTALSKGPDDRVAKPPSNRKPSPSRTH